ncbi:MAG: tetratricopeptide repeat protein [Armatimonadetes bacterium]|nr:tetratricopeptide repeat protein [Armatimonadota bacterium]
MEREQEPQQVTEADEEPGAAEAQAEELINAATESLAAGDTGRALRAARRATELAPDLAAAWVIRGTAAEEAGHLTEAIEAYRAALEADPDRPALAEHIEELERQLEREEATEPRRTAPFLDRYAPAFLAASVAMLILAIGLGVVTRNRRAALREHQYQRVMELGIRYLAQDQVDQAIAAFTDALRLKPGDPEAQKMLQQAKQRQQILAQWQQWNYMTAGGRFPGQEGTLPPAEITPTRERREQEASAGSPAGGSGRVPSWQAGGRTYHWGPPASPSDFPSPRQEFGPPEYMASSPGPASSALPQTPYGQYQTPQGQSPATATPSPPTPAPPQSTQQAAPQEQARSGEGGTAAAAPKGYVRIVVGERKPSSEQGTRAPSADSVRERADQLRRAGRLKEARELYQQAIELYRKEAEADPAARATKEAGIDSCRQAIEQCEQ